MIRFYLDENLSPDIAKQLEKRGIEVFTTQGLGTRGQSDLEHLKRAKELGCVLCTYDTDFLRLASEGIEHAGIVFGTLGQHFIGDWVKFLELVAMAMESEEMQNHVEYL
jgi:predicted nuclease of predicted toxin-antitoxin system